MVLRLRAKLPAAIVAFLESPAEAATELKFRHLETIKFASAAVAISAMCAVMAETIATKNKTSHETTLNAIH